MMEKIRLDELCDINMGQSPDSNSYNQEKDGLPFFQGNADFGELYPTTRMWCNKPLKVVEKDTLLISVRAPIGALNFATEKCCIGRGLAGIKPKEEVNLKYIFYCLKYKKVELNNKGTGSTFKAIAKTALGEIKIKALPKQEQDYHSEVLDKVSNIIAQRKEQLILLDDLIKSRFVEMFGDQKSNPMKWDKGTIRDIVTEVKYGTSKPAVEGGKYKYLRMNNITFEGELNLSSLKYIDIPENEYEKCVVRKGDVMFNRTNSKELVGKTCVFNQDEEMIIAGYIIRVRTNEKALPEYLSALLNSKYGKETLYGMCKAIVGQANINAQELQDIGILIPPVAFQQTFVAFKEQVDKLKVEVQNSLREAQLLFDSLMQKYFG